MNSTNHQSQLNPHHHQLKDALEARAALEDILRAMGESPGELGFGVGIAFGYAALGMVGDDTRSDYTANGTVINLAARLCEDAQADQILVNQRTLSEVESSFDLESLGIRNLRA